jgi:DNA-binding LacI/PurR family transcriptional regulator
MGEIAAETLVDKIEKGKNYPDEIAVGPELIIRETRAPSSAWGREVGDTGQ